MDHSSVTVEEWKKDYFEVSQPLPDSELLLCHQQTISTMSEEGIIAALVIDNGSGFMKGEESMYAKDDE